MVSRIQEWAAEQWFNGPQGGTPITAERLNNIETQIEGITDDLNTLYLESETITQAAYDALGASRPAKLYVIVG